MGLVKLPPAEQNFVIFNADWDLYVTFSDRLGKYDARCQYDGVNLELMTVSPEHVRARLLLGALVWGLFLEMDIVRNVSMIPLFICRRKDLGCGFETEASCWIAHKAQISGYWNPKDIDLARDPPPDLILEVEISRSYMDRLAIAARLGVAEVWRWDGETLHIMLLGPEGQYSESERSRALPFLPIAGFVRFLHPKAARSDSELLDSFGVWVREQMASGWGSATP
jgi:hypothetical protein